MQQVLLSLRHTRVTLDDGLVLLLPPLCHVLAEALDGRHEAGEAEGVEDGGTWVTREVVRRRLEDDRVGDAGEAHDEADDRLDEGEKDGVHWDEGHLTQAHVRTEGEGGEGGRPRGIMGEGSEGGRRRGIMGDGCEGQATWHQGWCV